MHNRIQRRHYLYVNTGKRSQKAYPIAKILYDFFYDAACEFLTKNRVFATRQQDERKSNKSVKILFLKCNIFNKPLFAIAFQILAIIL